MAATVDFYRLSVEALALIVRAEWTTIELMETLDKREHLVEDFVITTASRKKRLPVEKDEHGNALPAKPRDPSVPVEVTGGNKAKYPCYEQFFGNMPSYLRRAAIRDALGLVASHNSRYNNWNNKKAEIITTEATDKQKKIKLAKLGKPPTFQAKTLKTPAMYRGSTRKIQKAVGVGRLLKNRIAGARTDAGGVCVWTSSEHAALKLFDGTSWRWYCVKIKIPKKIRFPESEGWIEGTPTLVPSCGTYEIHVSMEKTVLFTTKGTGNPVLSVDLGLNTPATAAVLTPEGTILSRTFINCSQNKGSLEHLLGEIARGYKQSGQPVEGRRSCRSLWNKVAHLTDEIAHAVSAQLVAIAKEHGCEAIVFEFLEKMKLPRNFWGARRLRKKLHYWLQARIQRYTKMKLQTIGIRFSRVLARGTSAEAFDGSGLVTRTDHSKIAHFKNGRTYDADLAASYNIAARYWIRELHDKHPKAKTEVKDQGDVVIALAGRGPSKRPKSKAACGNTTDAGKGIAIPTTEPDVRLYVTGVPVARHQQTLASLISLNHWVGVQNANTLKDRIHATVTIPELDLAA